MSPAKSQASVIMIIVVDARVETLRVALWNPE